MASRRMALAAVAASVAAVWSVYAVPEAVADHCSRGEGTLSGPAIDGKVPSGKAKWLGNPGCQPVEMEVEVKDVILPDSTVLSVDACDSGIIGTITLEGGSGKLNLNTRSGDSVPFCDMRFGDPVTVLNGSTVVVSGCVSDSSGRIPGAPDC